MKFAHLSDVHLGSWREDSLRQLGMQAFNRAIDICIEENVGCILISGDLFNTSMPSIDVLKEAAAILSKVKEHDINVYVIPGSHDYSASGKTMIDVLEKSGLILNVAKLENGKLEHFIDKTGLMIAGWHGRKGGLERYEYRDIKLENQENRISVFMFHTMLEEFKPEALDIVDCMSVNELPAGFSYYAGGHPHYVIQGGYGNGKIAYPGALFPNNFKELEKFKHGGFYIIDDKLSITWIPVYVKEVVSFSINADGKSPSEVENEVVQLAEKMQDKVVTIRIAGMLREGKPSDINHKRIDNAFSHAYFLLKNTNKLNSIEAGKIGVKQGSVEQVEKDIIDEYLTKNVGHNISFVNNLIAALDKEKEDGETNADFENRVVKDAIMALALEEEYDIKKD